ncbi:MAG TPA: hypothetical protein V6C97_25750 [Oculatellaceae cyanobacterium]
MSQSAAPSYAERAQRYRRRQLELFDLLEEKASRGEFGSFIPIAENFADDNRTSLAAIKFLPQSLSEKIWRELSSPLQDLDGHQFFFAQESLHMTVQNVRKVSDVLNFGSKEIGSACAVLRKSAQQFGTFKFSLEGLMIMPGSVAIRAIAEPRFGEFSRFVRDELKRAGVADDKPYIDDDVIFGNITFCRFTKEPSVSFRAKLRELKAQTFGTVEIDSFALATTNAICDLNKTVEHESFALLGSR